MSKRRRPQRRPTPGLPAALPPAANPALQAAIMEIVEQQLASSDPPETRQTLDRLVADGYTREGARQLIAHAVLREIFVVMSSGRPYDAARYRAALARLPDLPDE